MNSNLKIIVPALKEAKFWIIVMCFECVNILFFEQNLSFSSFSLYLTLLTYIFGISEIVKNYKRIKKESNYTDIH